MAKKRGKRIFNKQEIAEDWCFECKDGGELMICEYGKCLKAYHPACVGKDDSELSSDKPWICEWHTCLVCRENSSDYHCYCCKRAACNICLPRIDFVKLKGNYGFCNDCLKLALLVEEDRNIDSDGECVDLRDRETYEGLFKEYYMIVKEKERFDISRLFAGKAQLDKEKSCRISSNSDKHSEEEDKQLSSDNGGFSDGEPQKKRRKKEKTKKQRRVNLKKKEFVGWGSKALIDFLQFIGQDTREKISQFDVSKIVLEYIEEHKLSHPVKKTRILCDVQLEAVFGKKEVNIGRISSLLKSHFVENEERLQKDVLDHDLENIDTDMFVAPKTEKKVGQNKISSIWYSTTAKSQFAALIPENIKLVYLKRSLVMEMIQQPESIETKIIGSFVRVKLDPRERNSHQLVQITGIVHGSNSESSIQVSNMARDVCLTMLSDNEISKEECDELAEKVKAGLLKKLTIVELEQKAKILHEDITKHRIAQELELLQKLINRAYEKGWRHEFYQLQHKRDFVQQPSYLSSMLQNIPRVIPEEVELEPMAEDKRDGNKMHQCEDETTPTAKNILGGISNEVQLERLAKDEKDVNQMHQCLKETTPTKKNILGVISKEVALERRAEDERDGNKMHQCADETTPTKKNILGGSPEKVEVEPLAEDEDELDHDLEDDDTEMLVAPKTEKKVEQNKISSIWYSTAARSQFAALIPENIKLIYLKRSLVLEMIKQPESIKTKIIGSFVRVKLDHYDQRNSHQLVQITGFKHGSSDKCHSESLIQVSNMATDVCLTMLSDDEISKEECDELAEKVKAGVLKKLTIVELEQKAKILHEDITKHRIAQELELLQIRINGARHQASQHQKKRELLQQPSYLSFVLQNIPRVIPEEVELESLDRNDNQMHQCSDETTPLGVTPQEVELEPMTEDERDGIIKAEMRQLLLELSNETPEDGVPCLGS